MLSNNTQIKKEYEISWSLNLVLSRIILKFERISDLIDCSSGIYSFKKCEACVAEGGFSCQYGR